MAVGEEGGKASKGKGKAGANAAPTSTGTTGGVGRARTAIVVTELPYMTNKAGKRMII